MRATPAIIERLNAMLTNELTAINQYFLHARMHRHWGYLALGERVYDESIGEMRHADALIERILFLDGLPNVQTIGKVRVGEDAVEALQSDLALETVARNTSAEAIAEFEREADYASRDLATKILVDSEEHIDFLETQLSLLEALGRPNFLQTAVADVPKD